MSFEREGSWKDFIKGNIKGFFVTIAFVLFYMLWDARPQTSKAVERQIMTKMEKNGVYFGAFLNFLVIYFYLYFTY